MGDITLERVSKHYDDVAVIDDMSLDIDDGKFVYLVGPLGCGKSTIMEMIAGLITPSEGKVFIGDREVTNLPPKDRGAAMVFQNIALFPHMDIYDNISFGLRPRNYDKEEIERRVRRAAKIVQLRRMLECMPDEMSDRQRQRVAIVRAIVRNPGVFLMNESFANLDAKFQVHMRTEFQHLYKELDTAIIYTTHDQAKATMMSNRIVVIDSERLQQIDPPLVCYNEPTNLFAAGFTGSSSTNSLDGEVVTDDFLLANIDVGFDPVNLGVEPGTDVTMSIRPGDVHLVDEELFVSNPSHRIDAVIDALELMGDEIFAYLKLPESAETDFENTNGIANDQLLMSVAPNADIMEDEDVMVVLDCSRVRLFDTATGEAISHGIEAPTQASGAFSTEAESDD